MFLIILNKEAHLDFDLKNGGYKVKTYRRVKILPPMSHACVQILDYLN